VCGLPLARGMDGRISMWVTLLMGSEPSLKKYYSMRELIRVHYLEP
jgi:hypothetical protein